MGWTSRRNAAAVATLAVAVTAVVAVPLAARAEIGEGRRLCLPVPGAVPGDLAVVNLTPVGATAVGNGQLVSSDVTTPPTASNVNFAPGTIDPNVAIAPIGTDGHVCFHNSDATRVHLVADLVAVLDAETHTPNPDGAPIRLVDTRTGLGGSRIAPGERRCFPTQAAPLDLAVVNLTPVRATAPGYGALTSSDATTTPSISNVNYARGTIDPNVAIAPIGPGGSICFHNGPDTTIDLVADLLTTLHATTRSDATVDLPHRLVDTRLGLGGSRLAPGERRCFTSRATPGDLAIVNLTPVGATARGHGALTASDADETPAISNVNYAPGTTDPNVAITPIGPDGNVCFLNGPDTTIDLVADLLTTLDATTLGTTDIDLPHRLVDTRPERRDTINCPTTTRCYAGGDQLYVSDDFGTTWDLSDYWIRPVIGFSVHVDGGWSPAPITCMQPDICTVLQYHPIGKVFTSWVTVDGGRVWSQQPVTSDIACPTTGTCILAGSSHGITFVSTRTARISTDGGRNWTAVPLPPTTVQSRLTAIDCSTPTECAAISVAGTRGNEVTTLITFTSTDGWNTISVSER